MSIEIYNKFEELPRSIKDHLVSPQALKSLGKIEDKYNINLMRTVFKVAIKEVKLDNLDKFFQEEYDVEAKEAKNLSEELKEKIFKPILDYLKKEKTPETDEEKAEEDEIKRLRGKIENIKPFMAEELINSVVKNSNLSFKDDVLNKRFRNIISARLRDVRDKIETKEVLMKFKKIGGLELENEEAGRVTEIIEEECKKLEEKLRKEIKLKKFEIFKAVRPVRAELPRNFENKLSEEVVKVEPKKEVIHPVSQKIIEPPKQSEPPKPVKPLQPVEKPKVIAPPVSLPKIDEKKRAQTEKQFFSKDDSDGRPKVQDIKPPPPKTMGPLEELKYLTVKDFRKLSDDPEEAIFRIKQKIDLLEKESFTKKVQGIKNWRQGEVNKLYLEIGSESIEKNKRTIEIIQGRIAQGKTTLSEREFEVVADLNKILRF